MLEKLCSAIARQEGWFAAGSRPQRNNNPGNARKAPWLDKYNVDSGYWKATSAAEGIAGLYYLVALYVARGSTLRQLLAKWAPAADGNSEPVYLANVVKWTGLDPDKPLNTYLTLTNG